MNAASQPDTPTSAGVSRVGTLVVLRHGQSTWNELNLFTGWHDVPLSPKGEAEADAAGRTLREVGLRFDVVYTSLLARAIETNRRALNTLGQTQLPVVQDWRLNERHYGALQGLDKKETTQRHGAEQTKLWRRSYDVPPPPVDRSSPEHPANDPRYSHIDASLLPATECLKDVVARVVPFWREVLVPLLSAGKNVLVVAHGNSLRALAMHLENITQDAIAEMNIPTGVPRKYEFHPRTDDDRVRDELRVSSVSYLGDAEAIAAATNAVAKQAGT
ncbi:MAG: 2,3-diphosphoglycerate-dependent phosphoglycerate mutase [Ilumatobacteraceae bacterium]